MKSGSIKLLLAELESLLSEACIRSSACQCQTNDISGRTIIPEVEGNSSESVWISVNRKP